MTQPVAKLINNGNFYVQGSFDEATYDPASSYTKNLCPYSQSYVITGNSNTGWRVTYGCAIIKTNELAPDGTYTAARIRFGPYIYSSAGTAFCWLPNLTQVGSMWVRVDSGTRQFALGLNGGGANASFTATTTWTRFSTGAYSKNVNYSDSLNIYANDGVAGGDVLIWGAQIEIGNAATDYEPTGASSYVYIPPGFTTRLDATGFYTVGSLDEVSINPAAGTRTNLIASSVFLANAKVTDYNYWSLGYSALAPELDTIAPDGTNTALTLLETNTASNYPVIQTGTSTTYGNTLVMTVGQWYTVSTYFSRPGLTPSLGTNPSYIALVMNDTNAFANFNLARNVVEYPGTTGAGVTQTATALPHTNTNGGSLKFNGTGNLTSTGTGIMAFGTNNFTIEYYMWKSGYSYGPTVFDSRTNVASSTGLNDLWYGNQYVVQVGGSTVFTSTAVLNIYSNWSHVAIVRSGTGTNQTSVYINGVLNGTFTCATNFTDPNLVIGNRIDNQNNLSGANLTNFRVTNGVALYSGNFTMPTAPPTAGANTSLLLNVIQSSSFVADGSTNNYTLTNTGVTYSAFNPNYNGWYRASFPFQATTTYDNFGIWANGFGGPPGDGNVLLVWGPQIESGNVATSYIPTINSLPATPYVQRIDNTGLHRIAGAYDEASLNPNSGYVKNYVFYSQNFSSTYWSSGGGVYSNVLANVTMAPDGTMTASKLVETANNNYHVLYQNAVVNNGVPGQVYCTSIYVKAAERYVFQMYAGGSSNWSTTPSGTFNLLTGTVVPGTFNLPAFITPVGNGWYRCSTQGICAYPPVGGLSLATNFGTCLPGTTTVIYQGDGNSGIYIWGSQMELSSLNAGPSTYVATGLNGTPLT